MGDYALGKGFYLIVHDAAIGGSRPEAIAILSLMPMPDSGQFTLTTRYPVLEKGNTYRISFYIDRNGDGICDVPPFDQGWMRTVGPVEGDTTLEFTWTNEYQDGWPNWEY